jgi:hypothetical protein
LASDFIHEHELGPLLKNAKEGGVKILWVHVRDSAYKQTALKDYQAVVNPDRPLSRMSNAKRDEAWVKICEGIRKAVNSTDHLSQPPNLEQSNLARQAPDPLEPIVTPAKSEPSSNSIVLPQPAGIFSTAQKLLADVGAQAIAEQQRSEAELEQQRRYWAYRKRIAEQSWGIIRENLERLWTKIRDAVPGAERLEKEAVPSLCVRLGSAEMGFTPINVIPNAFRESKWDVLQGFYIWASQTKPRYTWSGNLWFLRLPEAQTFRWYEVSYFETLQSTRPAPFGVNSRDDYQNADLAASVVVGPWQLAFGAAPVDGEQEEPFHERWIERFAQAAGGKLHRPKLKASHCQWHKPAPAPRERAPELSFSAEKESLFELAANDRRAAIKKSWELLAKDILWAGNIGMGRSDPDSPAMSSALGRLESGTTHSFELVVELKDLRATARKVFNQSQWAYDPSESEAREFILRCEAASQQLRSPRPST